MPAVIELAIVLMFCIPLVLIIGGVALIALKILKGSSSEQDAQEARMIQDIHTGLQRMEKRVEALETIMLEQERKDHS